jgi:UPF0755 protein
MRKLLPILIICVILCVCLSLVVFTIPARAQRLYGPPATWLTFPQRVEYAAKLLWYDGLLTRPLDVNGPEQTFFIEPGESVTAVAGKLENAGLIRSANAFRDYLIYSGLDTSMQAGEYRLTPALSIIEIARELQDATSSQVTFVILPGWRMEACPSRPKSFSAWPVLRAQTLSSSPGPPRWKGFSTRMHMSLRAILRPPNLSML